MIFYGNKKRLRIFITAGYSTALLTFILACLLNISEGSLRAHALLLVSFLVFFIVYYMAAKYKTGILAADDKGLAFQAGMRKIDLEWDRVESIEISKINNHDFVGINLKTTDPAKNSFDRFLEYNKKASGYHIAFKQNIFEEDISKVAESLKELLLKYRSRNETP